MGLFDLIKPRSNANEYIFTLEEHFKGFKAFPIVVHGNNEAEKNNEKLRNQNLVGRSIKFKIETKDRTAVFIDNKLVGSIFEEYQIKALRSGKVKAVYAKMEEEKIITNSRLKPVVTRHRAYLFVKYEE